MLSMVLLAAFVLEVRPLQAHPCSDVVLGQPSFNAKSRPRRLDFPPFFPSLFPLPFSSTALVTLRASCPAFAATDRSRILGGRNLLRSGASGRFLQWSLDAVGNPPFFLSFVHYSFFSRRSLKPLTSANVEKKSPPPLLN